MKTDEKGQPVTSFSDNQIMEDVRDGRVEKLAMLFERHHIMLFNFFLRLSGRREGQEAPSPALPESPPRAVKRRSFSSNKPFKHSAE